MKNINFFTLKSWPDGSINIDINENAKIILTENGVVSEKVNYFL